MCTLVKCFKLNVRLGWYMKLQGLLVSLHFETMKFSQQLKDINETVNPILLRTNAY